MISGRRAGRTLAALALVVLGSGCRLDVSVDVSIGKTGQGTVAVTAKADAEMLAKAPGVLNELKFDDLTSTGWTVGSPAAQADGSTSITLSKPFASPAEANLILGGLNGPKGPLHDLAITQTRSFSRVTTAVSGSVSLQDGLDALSDSELTAALGNKTPLVDVVTGDIASQLGLTVTVHLPGRAVGVGTGAAGTDPGVVAFTPSLRSGDVTAIEARAALVDQGALDARRHQRWAVVGLIAYVAVMAAVVARLLARRRRPTRNPRAPVA